MQNKNATRLVGLLAAAAGLSWAASASATPVSFNFTGTTSSVSTGIYSGIAPGTPVSGTITIDYAQAIPSEGVGTVGTPTAGTINAWQSQSNGGSDLGSPPVYAVVFRETVIVGANIAIYQTDPVNGFHVESGIEGSSGTFTAVEAVYTSVSPQFGGQSLFQLLAGAGPQDAYDSNGLPNFAHASGGIGYFSVFTGDPSTTGTVQYVITSVTAVPLPASVWLLLSGLVGVGAMARKRRAA